MLKIKEIFNMYKTRAVIKNITNSDMYNTEIFRTGVKNLLNEYKGILENSNNKNDTKIKELDFHIKVLDKVSADYLN